MIVAMLGRSGILPTASTNSPTVQVEARAFHPLINLQDNTANDSLLSQSHFHIDKPTFDLLEAGRHHFENATAGSSVTKKGNPSNTSGGGGGSSARVAPPTLRRCQVEGCQVVLVNVKDYHRRHKVCEMHGKAPGVVVHGIEQSIFQQCSRFHAVSEFDESKRRLAGHNLRRRKNPQHVHHSLARRPYQDLPSRCNTDLHDLIEENRAAILATQLNLHQMKIADPTQNGSVRFLNNQIIPGIDFTLDLIQAAPSSGFRLLSMHNKSGEERCSESWKVPLGY